MMLSMREKGNPTHRGRRATRGTSRHPLRLQWVVILLGFQQVILVGGLWLLYSHMGASYVEQAFVDRIKTLTHYLAMSAEFALLSGNPDLLPTFRLLNGEREFLGLRIYDDRHQLFYQDGSFPAGDDVMVVSEPVMVNAAKLVGDEAVFMTSARHKPEKIGDVVVYASRRPTVERLHRIQISILILSAIALAASVLVGFLILRSRFLEPVATLMETVERIRGGDFKARADVSVGNELDDLARAFNSMVQELERLMRERVELAREVTQRKNLELIGELSAMLVHEVGNTLNRFSIIRHRLADESLSSEGREALEHFENELSSLRRFTENVSLFSKRPELKLEPVEITGLVRALVSSIQLCSTKKVEFQVRSTEEECTIMADQGLLNKALLNLLNNALQASPVGATVEVEIEASGDHVEISIIDHGKGIPPHLLGKVFQPFFTTKGPLGTGLGLPIAKSFIEAHGGSIAVESRPGLTRFSVRLPKVSILQE